MDNTLFKIFITLFLALALTGCAKFGKSAGKIVARVNNDPIYLSDLQSGDEMDSVISRKLLIQEAQKLKLDRKDGFVNTIKTFREQALINDLIAVKGEEFANKITATDEEIKNYYGKLSYKLTFKIIKRDDEDLLKKMLAVEKDLIPWQEEIGPIGYDEINSNILLIAFDFSQGDARVFQEGNNFYLVYVAKKEPVSVPALNEIYSSVEEKVKLRKQNFAMQNWLNAIKKKATIHINKKTLAAFMETK